MALTIELPPDVEARLAAEAAARGLDVATWAAELLSSAAPAMPAAKPRTEEDFQSFAAALAEGSDNLPDLPTDSFTRQSFYSDRG